MREREYSLDNKFSQNFSLFDKFQRKIGAPFRGALVLLAVSAASCGGDDSKSEDSTRTPILEPTGVERTITPTTSPTEEATLIVIASPTPEPTSEPTTDYVPPVVTPRPTLRPTPIPTPVMIRPTLEPTPVPAPRPTSVPTPTPEPIPTPRPTKTPVPTPTPFPQLEVCNTGKFINPVDGQEVPTRVDVRAELAHDGNYDLGCKSPTGGADVILIDTFGNRFKWDLYCFDTSPNPNDDSDCHREGVILAGFPRHRWGMELKIEDLLLEKISVVIRW